MKKVIYNVENTSDFYQKWFHNGIANSMHNGILSQTKRLADLKSEMEQTQEESSDPNGEQTQAKLQQLADQHMQSSDNLRKFEASRDKAAGDYFKVSGTKWKPFSKKANPSPKRCTDANAYIAKVLASK
jgi:glutamate synthase domain-containing protein 3